MLIKEHLLDKRVLARALKLGTLDRKAHQKMLDELPDLADRVQKSEPPAEPRTPSDTSGNSSGQP